MQLKPSFFSGGRNLCCMLMSDKFIPCNGAGFFRGCRSEKIIENHVTCCAFGGSLSLVEPLLDGTRTPCAQELWRSLV